MIFVNEPLLSGNELKYVSDCVQSNWISSSGKYLEQFESKWAVYCGQKYGVGMCNGTVALEAAVAVCKFPEGSEIILPSFTIISCVQAITKSKCVPVLVDCDPETYCVDVEQIEKKITGRTVAIMPVHIYGNPCDMDPIMDIAEKYKLIVIEDAAEAHGAQYLSYRQMNNLQKGKKNGKDASWRRCGSFGHLSCFSFYANKIITTGEGGMVLTSDNVFSERLRMYRNLCFQNSPRFLHNEIGDNYRMTNIQAALGVAQLEQIDGFIERKVLMAKKYSALLRDLPLKLPSEREWARSVIWMYALLVQEDNFKKQKIADYLEWPNYKIMKKLHEHGVETRPFFIGIHEQPVFSEKDYFRNALLPVTERISRTGFYLPSGQAITDDQIEEVSGALQDLFR